MDPFLILVDDRTTDDLAAERRQQASEQKADDWAAYVADMAELESQLEAERLELLAVDEWAQAGWPVRLRQEEPS